MTSAFERIRVNEAIRARSGPEWNWRSGYLPDYDIWLPFEGEGTIECEGVSHTVARGDCFFLRKGSFYIADQKQDSQLRCLGIHFDFLDENGNVTEPEELPAFHVHLTNTNFVVALAERTVDAWRRDNPGQRNPEALHIWGSALFEEIMTQHASEQQSGVWRGRRILIERICSAAVATPDRIPSLPQMADQMGVSRWQFCRIFKQHMGVTPQDYIIHAKTDAAKSLLETTNLSAKQIAAQLGYSDASHFNKHFKRHVGYTPIEYRKRTRP